MFRGLLPEGGVFAILAAHRHDLFPEELFSDLFPSGRGRPSVPVEQIAAVIVMQTLHGLSDREAAEAVTFDLRWKAACGLAVTDTGFHPTTLTYWRRRLARSTAPNRIFVGAHRSCPRRTSPLATMSAGRITPIGASIPKVRPTQLLTQWKSSKPPSRPNTAPTTTSTPGHAGAIRRRPSGRAPVRVAGTGAGRRRGVRRVPGAQATVIFGGHDYLERTTG
jgi:hypothetical protein